MNHNDHVALLRKGVVRQGGEWADLGAGSGAFTLALAELLGDDATIYAVDRDRGALDSLERALRARFPKTHLRICTRDFTEPLGLPPLDGVVMANSLHFIKHKAPALKTIRSLLKTDGRLLIVEYDDDRGNQWVPYPFTYPMWQRLAAEAGFVHTEKLAAHPSSWMRGFYSAASWG